MLQGVAHLRSITFYTTPNKDQSNFWDPIHHFVNSTWHTGFTASTFPSGKGLCLEDLWGDFVKIQHDSAGVSIYANGFSLVHARFGLLIITSGHLSRGRLAKGRMRMSARCEKWRAGLKISRHEGMDLWWRGGTHHFLIWVSHTLLIELRWIGEGERDGGVFIQSLIIFHSVLAVTLEAAAVWLNC